MQIRSNRFNGERIRGTDGEGARKKKIVGLQGWKELKGIGVGYE